MDTRSQWMRPRWWYGAGGWVGLVVALLAMGCEQREPIAKVDKVTGVIREIDLAGRRVTLEFERQDGQSRGTLVAYVPADAKIFVNGVASALDELRVGETATGFGTRQKQDGATRITALEIYVERSVMAPGEPPAPSSTGEPPPPSSTAEPPAPTSTDDTP